MSNGIAWCTGPDGSPGLSWNPVVGCSAVSDGCRSCWAAAIASRGLCAAHRGLAEHGRWIPGAGPRFLPETLAVPLRRRKPTGYAVCLMGDLFHEGVTDEQIDSVFAVMALTQRHRYYLLTKRAARMADYLASRAKSSRFWEAACPSGWALRWEGLPLARFPLPNAWLGVSVENQATADSRIPALLRCPAAVRWVSCEPLLEAVNLAGTGMLATGTAGFVVGGGESGPKARPMQVEWAASLRDQCMAAGVAYFAKQFHGPGGRAISDPARFPPGDWPREWPEVSHAD